MIFSHSDTTGNPHLAQQLERVLRDKGFLATLIHCVSAERFQREPNRKGLPRIADIVLHAALEVVKAHVTCCRAHRHGPSLAAYMLCKAYTAACTAHLIADVNVADGQLQVANDGVDEAPEHATAAALAILLGLRRT